MHTLKTEHEFKGQVYSIGSWINKRIDNIYKMASVTRDQGVPVHALSMIVCQVLDISHLYMMYNRDKEAGTITTGMKFMFAVECMDIMCTLDEMKRYLREKHAFLGKERLEQLMAPYEKICQEYLAAYRDNGIAIRTSFADDAWHEGLP